MRQCTKRLCLSKRITANDNKICVLYNCAFLLHKKPQLHSPKGVQNGKFCPICLLKSRNMIIKGEPCFCGNTLRFFGKGTAHGTLCQKIRWKKACANNKNCAQQSRFTGYRKPTPIIQKNTVVKVRYAFHLDKIKFCKEFVFCPFPFPFPFPVGKGKTDLWAFIPWQPVYKVLYLETDRRAFVFHYHPVSPRQNNLQDGCFVGWYSPKKPPQKWGFSFYLL